MLEPFVPAVMDGKNQPPYYPDPPTAPLRRTRIRTSDPFISTVSYVVAITQIGKETTEFSLEETCRIVAHMFQCEPADVVRDVRAWRTKNGYPRSAGSVAQPEPNDGGVDRAAPSNNVRALFDGREPRVD